MFGIGPDLGQGLTERLSCRLGHRYFPPFKPFVNGNHSDHLGAEYLCIAQSLVAGEGFASPFKERTGPTAWMPPVLAYLEAGLLWLCDGSRDAVMAVVVVLQVYTVVGTGLLVLALIVVAFGPLLDLVPLHFLQLAIGVLLLLFGMRWLRKAILRSAGVLPLHDEAAAFKTETTELREHVGRLPDGLRRFGQ